MMLTYYNLRGRLDSIAERAKKQGEKKLVRALEKMLKQGLSPMPEKICPSTGFVYITRFFTASVVLSFANTLGLNGTAVPVVLSNPKISDRVLEMVKTGRAPPEVMLVVITELMLPDIDTLVPTWSEKRDKLATLFRKYPQLFWAQLIVTTPLPFDYYMTPEEYEEEIVEKWGADLFFLQKLTYILEEVMDDVLGDGKPVFPEKLFKLMNINTTPEQIEILKANMLRKLPPRSRLEEILAYINTINPVGFKS